MRKRLEVGRQRVEARCRVWQRRRRRRRRDAAAAPRAARVVVVMVVVVVREALLAALRRARAVADHPALNAEALAHLNVAAAVALANSHVAALDEAHVADEADAALLVRQVRPDGVVEDVRLDHVDRRRQRRQPLRPRRVLERGRVDDEARDVVEMRVRDEVRRHQFARNVRGARAGAARRQLEPGKRTHALKPASHVATRCRRGVIVPPRHHHHHLLLFFLPRLLFHGWSAGVVREVVGAFRRRTCAVSNSWRSNTGGRGMVLRHDSGYGGQMRSGIDSQNRAFGPLGRC